MIIHLNPKMMSLQLPTFMLPSFEGFLKLLKVLPEIFHYTSYLSFKIQGVGKIEDFSKRIQKLVPILGLQISQP
jgi:hypothetical protein